MFNTGRHDRQMALKIVLSGQAILIDRADLPVLATRKWRIGSFDVIDVLRASRRFQAHKDLLHPELLELTNAIQ